MGVKGLFSLLRRRYALAFSSERSTFDHIYIDANGILYVAALVSTDPEYIARTLLEISQEYADEYGGRVHVYLDGPPHAGKIRHQRLRRFLYGPMTLNENSDGTYSMWSQAIFTPGTYMMNFINDYCQEHMHEYPGIDTFSPSSEPGEGEHKLLVPIRDRDISERIAIVGKDGDLLLLGMGMDRQNITILRHDDKGDNNTCRACDKIWEVDCPKLRDLILAEMKLDEIWSFIIATFLSGNDFLPTVPQCSDIYKTLPKIVKRRVRLYDAKTKTIRWKGIFILLAKLKGGRIDDRWVGKVDDPDIFNQLYYVKYSPFPIEPQSLVQQWLMTIEWIFRYYHDGLDTASRSWVYYPTFSPTIETILEVGISSVKNMDVVVRQSPPLSAIQSLAIAMPPWLESLLPAHVRDAKEKYAEYFPYSFTMNEVTEYPNIPTIPYSIGLALPRE